MPANLQDKAQVICPHCGHGQMEPRLAISTHCRRCGRHLVLQELLRPRREVVEKVPEQRRVSCFDCNTELEVPTAAQSTMCKRCSRYIDLHDYTIGQAVSKNFKTKGRLVVEAKGYVFNTEVIARDIVIRGRILGKLAAEHSLTVYSTAEIKGTFQTPLLVIPAGNCFHWKGPLRVGSVEILGELVSDICADLSVIVRATGRLFGDVRARHLVVEEGAVLMGQACVRSPIAATPG